MRLFDSVLSHVIMTVLSCVVTCVNLLTIYAIWRHSPKTMGKFRYYMLNMAAADFLFAFSLSWIFLPNLLVPLPAALAEGLMRFFGPTGAFLAFVVSIITAGFSMTAVRECSIYRVLIFFKMDNWLRRANGWIGLIFELTMYLLTIAFVSVADTFTVSSREEIREYAERYNLTHITDSIPPDAPLVAFDVDKTLTILVHVFIGIFLVFTATLQLSSNFAVHRKILDSKSSMSKTSLQLQRSLTYVLFTQAVVPVYSLSVPVIIYQVALFFYIDALLQSVVVEWLVILTVGGYPLVNCFFCLYLLKPYRVFCTRLFKRIFCCKKEDEQQTAVVVENTASSVTSTAKKSSSTKRTN